MDRSRKRRDPETNDTSRSKKARESTAATVNKEYHFCGHCKQHLALKTFRRHRKLFWDAEGSRWLIPGSKSEGMFLNNFFGIFLINSSEYHGLTFPTFDPWHFQC